MDGADLVAQILSGRTSCIMTAKRPKEDPLTLWVCPKCAHPQVDGGALPKDFVCNECQNKRTVFRGRKKK
mgnify:CR=1 FL=1